MISACIFPSKTMRWPRPVLSSEPVSNLCDHQGRLSVGIEDLKISQLMPEELAFQVFVHLPNGQHVPIDVDASTQHSHVLILLEAKDQQCDPSDCFIMHGARAIEPDVPLVSQGVHRHSVLSFFAGFVEVPRKREKRITSRSNPQAVRRTVLRVVGKRQKACPNADRPMLRYQSYNSMRPS